MIIESKKLEFEGYGTGRRYRILYRKDRRYAWCRITFNLVKDDQYGWELDGSSIGYIRFPREVILRIEAIIRGLNSNG